MRKGWSWVGAGLLAGVLICPVLAQEPDPEEVRRRMEIYLREEKPAPVPKPKPAVDYDHEAWKSAEKCGTAACFEAYLEDYPKGRYSRMAKARLKPKPESKPASKPEPAPRPVVVTPPPEPAQPKPPAVVSTTRLEERMTATVVEFAVRGDLDVQAGAIVADLMMSAIALTGRFTLKDRLALSAAAKTAKAQELGYTGLLDPKTAAELGRLYGVQVVVTGGVYKIGDLITVTARLIDTRTAALLRSGQIQGKDIDTIQIKINELAAMITQLL